MACTRPLKGIRQKDGKVSILDRATFERYQKNGRVNEGNFSKDRQLMFSRYGDAEIFDIPCGKCLNCRLDYARKWSQRCLLESKCWAENFFITLTYDEENLPLVLDYSTGDVLASTLVPKDVTLFLKRLREYYAREFNHQPIRFYLGGEYGDHSFRAHYHFCAFNLPIFDLTYYAKSPLGDVYYNSESLSRLWGKGHVVVGELTAQSAAYVARYCQKKATKSIDYEKFGIEKEFVRMSRSPGIGYPYLEKHLDIYVDDIIYLPNGQTCTPMRYFDTKAEEFGIDIECIKRQRQLTANLLSSQQVDEVSRDYYRQLEDLEQEFVKRSRILTRDKI